MQPIHLALHFAHAPLGFVVRRVLAEIAVLIGGGEILAHGRRDFRLQVMQLRLQLLEALARQLEDGRFFAASLGAAALAPHAQARAEIGLGELLGLEVGQEHLEGFDARRRVADRVSQILLVALDFQLGDLRSPDDSGPYGGRIG